MSLRARRIVHTVFALAPRANRLKDARGVSHSRAGKARRRRQDNSYGKEAQRRQRDCAKRLRVFSMIISQSSAALPALCSHAIINEDSSATVARPVAN